MKRAFIIYTESDEQVSYSSDTMILPAKESMALEFSNPQFVDRILKLFPKTQDAHVNL